VSNKAAYVASPREVGGFLIPLDVTLKGVTADVLGHFAMRPMLALRIQCCCRECYGIFIGSLFLYVSLTVDRLSAL
jgi:hypothetical protein